MEVRPQMQPRRSDWLRVVPIAVNHRLQPAIRALENSK
jgi:hypothetical protein